MKRKYKSNLEKIFGVMIALVMFSVTVLGACAQSNSGQIRCDADCVSNALTMHGLQVALQNQYENNNISKEAYTRLSRNVNLVQTRLQTLKNVDITELDDGDILIEGDDEARLFGLFKFQRRHTYRYTESGDIEMQRKWYDFMWRFNNLDNTEDEDVEVL